MWQDEPLLRIIAQIESPANADQTTVVNGIRHFTQTRIVRDRIVSALCGTSLGPIDFQWEKAHGSFGLTPTRRVELRWLGTAGFELSCDGSKLLIDPYLTRAPLKVSAFSRLRPHIARINSAIGKVDGIVVSHSHFDHVLDVPEIAKRTGAPVWGSQSTANLLHAAGLDPSQIKVCRGGETFDVGSIQVHLIGSVHSKFLFGARVPFPGDIQRTCRLPLRASQYRCGDVFGIGLKVAGLSFFHCGSANLSEEHLTRRKVDVLLVCISARHSTPNFVRRLLSRTNPRIVIPHHFDDFFQDPKKGLRVLPLIAFERFVDEVREFDATIRIATLPLGGVMSFG